MKLIYFPIYRGCNGLDANQYQPNQNEHQFHRSRRPGLYFEYGGHYYEGSISHYWNSGFRIVTTHQLSLQIGGVLPRIKLLSSDRDQFLHELTITALAGNEGTLLIDVDQRNPAAVEQFYQQFHIAFLGHSPLQSSGNAPSLSMPSFIGRKHYTQEATEARQQWLEQATGSRISHVSQSIFHDNPSQLAGNIENYIGSVQIPLGLAGPLWIRGTYANGYSPIPIATTEGALISSISRGAKACNAAGGIEVQVVRQTMVRAPVFFCGDMRGALLLAAWMEEHSAGIKAKAESASSVARLVSIQTRPFGDQLHVQFCYETGDAAGQNMTTSCTFVACEWTMDQVKDMPEMKVLSYMIEGNMAGDKKVSMRSFIEGRGIGVIASVHIPEAVFRQTMRLSTEQYMHRWYAAEVGGLRTGMVGHNVNFANVLAGIFTATGQDIACVHESSCGIFKPRQESDGISIHLELPSLVIGTVGGGTGLPTQRECLEMLGCGGPGKAFKLAEIMAAACLALDVSTSAAIGSNEFVKAHEKLGRKSSQTGISRGDITARFFQSLLGDQRGKVKSFESIALNTESSVVTNMMKKQTSRFQGLHRYALHLQQDGVQRELPVVLKVKSDDREMMDLGIGIAKLSGEDRLSGLFESQMHIFGFEGAHLREIALYKHASAALLQYCPDIYGVIHNEDKEAYAILMEDLSSCSHMNAIQSPEEWDDEHIGLVLGDLAAIHAVYLDQEEGLPAAMGVEGLDVASYVDATELLLALTDYNHERFPALMSKQLHGLLHRFIRNIPSHIEEMLTYHRTLTHNDFNPRNLGLRVLEDGEQVLEDKKQALQDGNQVLQDKKKQLVVYDWELASYGNPQHDCLEFLIYTLSSDAAMAQWDRYLDGYRQSLEKASGHTLDKQSFEHIAILNALEMAAVRFNLYLLANNLLHLPYMERVYLNLSRFITEKLAD